MPAILSNTAAYASQLLRNQKVEGLDSRLQRRGEGSTMILSARGTFYLVKLSADYGPGLYAIDELNRPLPGPVQSSLRPTDSPILITSVEFNQTDITSQVPCLDNVKVFYSFGQNFGQVVINGEILLGPLGDINYDGADWLMRFFWLYRVSVSGQPILINASGNPYYVYLTGLRIGQVQPEFHVLPFVLSGTLLDLEREKATAATNVRHPGGVVVHGGNLNEPSLFAALNTPPQEVTVDTSQLIGQDTDPVFLESNADVTSPFTRGRNVTGTISTDRDPSLHAAPGGGESNVGAAGNTKAAEVEARLNQQSMPLLSNGESNTRDGLPKQPDLTNPAVTNRVDTASVTRVEDARLAQSYNLQSGGKRVELPQTSPADLRTLPTNQVNSVDRVSIQRDDATRLLTPPLKSNAP